MKFSYELLEPIKLKYIDIPKWIHPDVYISYSKIKNAGLGIFANKQIKEGTFLGSYLGEIKNETDCYNDPYVFDYKENKKISALNINKSNYTRFINCSYNYNSENVYCLTMNDDYKYNKNKNLKNRRFFYTQKKIQKDEELLFYYGDDYAKLLNITYRLGDHNLKNFNE
jgi:hypothetical protein